MRPKISEPSTSFSSAAAARNLFPKNMAALFETAKDGYEHDEATNNPANHTLAIAYGLIKTASKDQKKSSLDAALLYICEFSQPTPYCTRFIRLLLEMAPISKPATKNMP
jgi:hypothetical protein